MNRNAILLVTALCWNSLVPAPPAYAQPRVGLLWLKSELTSELLPAFREGLLEHGFVEGKNVRFERRDEVETYGGLPDAAAALVKLKVDVILAWGDTATQAAGKATTSIPIVMLAGTDPVKAGLAVSLGRPGRNVTGFTAFQQELVGKRIELLKEAVPRVKTIAILMNPASVGQPDSFRQAKAAAEALGLSVQLAEVRTPKDIGPALAAASRSGANAVMAVPSNMLASNRSVVIDTASSLRLPGVFTTVAWAEQGALMAYGIDTQHTFRVGGRFVGRILKGANPAEMPFERATKLFLIINLKAARALGVTIPPSMLLRADRVIE
jgi:putative ABC transport system substrate-binding protein